MLALSKKSIGATLIIVFVVYGIGGPVLANTLTPFMKDAKDKSQCTNLGGGTDGCTCKFTGEYINEKYLPIYNLLNYPAEKIGDLTSSSPGVTCDIYCGNTFEPVIENGKCTPKSVPGKLFEHQSQKP